MFVESDEIACDFQGKSTKEKEAIQWKSSRNMYELLHKSLAKVAHA